MTLSEIIEALEKAPHGSRELDWRVAEYLEQIPAHRIIPVGWDYGWYRGSETVYALWKATDSEGRSVELWQAPEITTSVDAALKLIELVLPDANCWGIDKDERGIQAHVQRNGVKSGHWAQFSEHRSSAPIALVLAIVKALQAKEPTP